MLPRKSHVKTITRTWGKASRQAWAVNFPALYHLAKRHQVSRRTFANPSIIHMQLSSFSFLFLFRSLSISSQTSLVTSVVALTVQVAFVVQLCCYLYCCYFYCSCSVIKQRHIQNIESIFSFPFRMCMCMCVCVCVCVCVCFCLYVCVCVYNSTGRV